MPLVSVEVRFFGDASDAFARFIDSAEIVPRDPESRTDVYGVDSGRGSDVGIKVRGKSKGLEVKTLVEPELACVQLGGREAKVQRWTKIASDAIELSKDARRVSVKKSRRMRELVPSCNVEWTLVETGGVKAWSFGLEASGAKPLESLRDAIRELESRGLPELPSAWREASYPAWLVRD